MSVASQNHPVLAREGWIHLVVSLVMALIASYFLGLWSWPFWVGFAFVVQFFRDPIRTIPTQADAVICPAHGKVVFTGPAFDPYLKRDALKVSVFMNVFSMHSNFTPVDGTIQKIWYHPGKFVNAALDKASEENERNAIWVKTPQEKDVVFIQIAGLIARRIMCHVKEQQAVGKGQRYGFIRFGSKVDVYLPLDAKITVSIGDTVVSGNDMIATLS